MPNASSPLRHPAPARKALIIGALGQDGSYLTELLLGRGYAVVGTTHRDPASLARPYPGELRQLDLGRFDQVSALIEEQQPDEIYNLGALASSAHLFDEAIVSGDINGLAATRILEAILQFSPRSRFCQALSSEIFANSTTSPQNESTPVAPSNAYGAAKTYALHMLGAYRSHQKLFACGAILYNHESPRRPAHFVTRKVTLGAARIALGARETLQLGSADHRRDWGHARDHVRAMHLMLQHDVPEDFVVATGITHSVAELCEIAFGIVGLDFRQHVSFQPHIERRQELHELRGDPSKARQHLGWQAEVTFRELIREMVEFDLEQLRHDARLTRPSPHHEHPSHEAGSPAHEPSAPRLRR